MVVREREAIIQSGIRLTTPEFKQNYGFPVEISGFQDLQRVRVPLADSDNVKKLLPDFEQHPDKYQPVEVVCLLEAGQPVMGIVSGNYFDLEEWLPITSLVNLAAKPDDVILVSSETEPLNRGRCWWPGYSIDKQEKNLKLGLATMLVEKHGERFMISFPRRRAV